MDAIELIKTRRSIRKYTKQNLSDEIIRKLIDAARHAPSSRDSQPWKFVIVKNQKTKEELAKIKGEENEAILRGAPVIIVVGVDTKSSPSRWVEDGVCALMNILVEAHSLGLGAVYVTGYSSSKPEVTQQLKEILGLPQNVMPACMAAVGHPDEVPNPKKVKEIDQLIHQERF